MSSAPNPWPPARVALLERLWRDGLTALQIGVALGATRSAVVGKLGRLGLLGMERPNLTFRQRLSVRANLYRRGKPRPIKLPALPKQLMQYPMKSIPIEALTSRSCRWIEADPRHVSAAGLAVLYCGERTVIGSPWCPAHYRRVYPRSMAMEGAA